MMKQMTFADAAMQHLFGHEGPETINPVRHL